MAATVLNDAQIDILNMMRWVKSDETLNDLKQAISDFFAKKLRFWYECWGVFQNICRNLQKNLERKNMKMSPKTG